MRKWLADQSLTIFFLAIFLLSLVGQSVAGFDAYNQEQRSHDQPTITYGRYLVSSDFGGNVMAQSLANRVQFNDEQAAHGEAAVSWFAYLREADFWNRTLQNWQSEFLAVATMAAFSIYLRQRGSPESKPVGAPHAETGSSG